MTDWYRRTDWDDDIAADFEARLARSRASSRAQYLSLQGYALMPAQPVQAEALLERAIATGQPSEIPRAACYLALARMAQGKVDGAIDAYEIAVAAERQNPAWRSSAGVDQALLIALHDRDVLFGVALDRLAMATSDHWSLAELEAAAAEALIRHARGERDKARERAQAALESLPDGAADAEWAGVSLRDLRARLEVIVR